METKHFVFRQDKEQKLLCKSNNKTANMFMLSHVAEIWECQKMNNFWNQLRQN